jgi:hypothetical protein
MVVDYLPMSSVNFAIPDFCSLIPMCQRWPAIFWPGYTGRGTASGHPILVMRMRKIKFYEVWATRRSYPSSRTSAGEGMHGRISTEAGLRESIPETPGSSGEYPPKEGLPTNHPESRCTLRIPPALEMRSFVGCYRHPSQPRASRLAEK